MILTVNEVGLLAQAVPEHYKALVLISAWCGLRWGEVIELRRKDIGAGCERSASPVRSRIVALAASTPRSQVKPGLSLCHHTFRPISRRTLIPL